MSEQAIKRHLDDILSRRDYPKTACPSEVARALSRDELDEASFSDWREAMQAVRDVAASMRPRVEICQKGVALPPDADLAEVKGPIRLRLAASPSS